MFFPGNVAESNSNSVANVVPETPNQQKKLP